MSTATEPASATVIRRFRVDFPAEAIDDLRRRLSATHWPPKELVADASQGVQSAAMPELVRYWAGVTTSAGSRRG